LLDSLLQELQIQNVKEIKSFKSPQDDI